MVLILLTALLCSCGANEATVSYNGTELSAEEIFELSESFPRETEAESEAETKPEETVILFAKKNSLILGLHILIICNLCLSSSSKFAFSVEKILVLE